MSASAKRILYQLVAPMEVTVGEAEVVRRRDFLSSYAAPGVTVEVRSVARGTASIESDYDAAMVIPYIIESIEAGAAEGADAAIVGCFSDPGLDAVRERVRIPVVGPGAAAMHLALQLGHSFSVISPNAGNSGRVGAYVRQLGLWERYASTRGMGLSVLDLARGDNSALERAEAAARRCIEEDEADVLVLGCMSMAFRDLAKPLQERLGVPVVNPVIVALKTAETMLAHGISHSRAAWPQPPQKEFHVGGASRRS